MRATKWLQALIILLMFSLMLATACSAGPAIRSLDEALFHDEFVPGQTGNWLVEGDEGGRAAVIDEQLHIEIDTPQLIHFVTLDEPSFADFILEVDVTQLSGDPRSSFGILFRMLDPGQFYRFEISGDGLFVVERHNADGSWTRFIEDWAESSAINKGLQETNHLKVVAIGSALAFYANDNLLLQASDSSYPAGQIALDAGTYGRPGLQVAFDNVVVRRP